MVPFPQWEAGNKVTVSVIGSAFNCARGSNLAKKTEEGRSHCKRPGKGNIELKYNEINFSQKCGRRGKETSYKKRGIGTSCWKGDLPGGMTTNR